MSDRPLRELGSRSRRATALAAVLTATVLGLSAASLSPSATAAPAAAPASALPAGLDLATSSIEDLQGALEAGEVTSVELVEAYLYRIEALNYDGPSLNAIRHVSEVALADAEAADEARAGGATGPLLGIPIIVKDNIDVEGMPTTAGSVALANSFPGSNAPVIDSLEEAGAIILGKANLTEFANFMTSGMPAGYSSLGGQVLNAYDLSQTPSGSSAGSGVAASTAMAAGTVGTETSGSILSPSNANSLVGIKPTVGLISRTGIIPISATQDTAGPMTRSVYDAAAILTGMTTGADPEDSATQDGSADEYDDVDYTAGLSTDALDGVRLGYVTSTNETYLAALDVLRAQGAELVEVSPPTNTTAGSILTVEFKRDLNAYLSRLPESAPMDTLADIIAYNTEHENVATKFGQSTLVASEAVDLSDPDTAASYEAAKTQGLTETRANIDATLEDNDIEAIVSNAGTTGIGARAGYPSLTLPAGYAAANRRPVAITFLGTAYTEQSLIEFAYDYEQAADVWKAPEEINPTAFRCTGISPETMPDESCFAEEEPAAKSVTLADLKKNPVKKGKAAVVRVAVAAGATVPSGRVLATIGGDRVAGGRLSDSGRATLTLPRSLKVGRYPVKVSYAGTAAVLSSSDKVTLRVVKKR